MAIELTDDGTSTYSGLNGVRPYRLVVFAQGLKRGKRSPKVCQLNRQGVAWIGWTPHQHCGQEARLPGAGSFLYPGFLKARQAAFQYLQQPCVTQVSVRTDQDRSIYRWVKQTDGRITGYACGGDND